MNKLLNFSRIESITAGEWLSSPQDPAVELCGGAFDTRSLGAAEIFFAWKGENSDGHQYLQHLTGSAVKLAIVEQPVSPLPGIAVLKVPDSQKALHQLARYLAGNFSGRIINVTGSSGKTTTKTWLTHLLKSRFNLLSNPGSFNNQIGCPITILSLNRDHNLMILEMGSSGLGDLELLGSIAPADIALLLNVGHAHVGKFGSLENTYRAKAEIFANRRDGALSIVPYGDKRLEDLLLEGRRLQFGSGSPDFSFRIVSVDSSNFRQKIEFRTPSGNRTVNVGQLGKYVGELLAAVLAVCFSLGLEWQDVEDRLISLPQEKGRSTFLKGISGALLLDDTYNANPESMINMLETIASLQMDRTVGVVGNLAELESGLSESADYILSHLPENLTTLFMSGDTGEILVPLIQKRLPNIETVFVRSVPEILSRLLPLMNSRTVVGIKGSRSSHMERVVLGLTEKAFTCDLERCGRLNRCDVCELLITSS